MRVLVVGGTGFIGVPTCRELMRRGFETIAAGRAGHPYGTFTSHVVLDRGDQGRLERVLDEVQPDVLIDLAAGQPAEVEAAIRLFRGRRYVLVSADVYPDLHGQVAAEDDFRPFEGPVPFAALPYLEGKRWCETVLARAPDFPSLVVRPAAVFGPGDPSLRIAAYLQRAADGGPLLVPTETADRPLSLAWVRDVGYGLALAADVRRGAPGRAYNLALEGVTLRQLVTAIAGMVDRPLDLVPVPFAEIPEGASPYGPHPARHAGLALDRARAELGFEPSSLGEALAETMAWYRVARPSHPGYRGRAAEIEIARRART